MKKLFLLCVLCLISLTVQAQRFALLDFQLGTNVTEEEIDALTYNFRVNFFINGYRSIPRERINSTITTLGFDRTDMTRQQILKLSRELEAKVVVYGVINKFMDEYTVEVSALDVSTGLSCALEGATFDKSNYRPALESLATKLGNRLDNYGLSGSGTEVSPAANSPQTGGSKVGYVDLGLSVNWRGWNVGANNPVEYGDHYAWGETRYGNPRFNWAMYEFGGNMYRAPEKYNPSDKKTVLEPGDDVANVRLGGKWRMPTEAEWTELITNCTCVWIDNYDGVGINGLFFTAENGNSIFLPAAGHGYQYGRLNAGTEGKYWSSSLDSTGVADWAPVGCNAWHVQFDAQNTAKLSSVSRCSGFSVRPVCEK